MVTTFVTSSKFTAF